MSYILNDIAKQLKDATHKTKAVKEKTSDVKIQLIYAFNGVGKTRLSREFKELIAPKPEDNAEAELGRTKILYYNAFTEDLFYWDNDLLEDTEKKLKIQPNTFTDWIFNFQGQDQNIIANFQRYTNEKLTPHFNEEYKKKNREGKEILIPAFSEVTFSYERGNDEKTENIKISKGEESCFIWSIFYSLIEQVVSVMNTAEPTDRETDQFNHLEYIFIDDPVSSLDDNHLIELAVNLAQLIKSSTSEVKFIITTHNLLFYNVLHNEFNKDKFKKYLLRNNDDGTYELSMQNNDSPFSYHLYLKSELEKAIREGQIQKYHFNFLRNILEKTSTFLGYDNWGDILPEETAGERASYMRRINIYSHSKHAGEEVAEVTDDDKRVLNNLVQHINNMPIHFKNKVSSGE